jgi:hypothetical protein
MNQSDINNYNNILSNTKINYSDKLWLGITNNTTYNGITNNTTDNINNSLTITEKLEKELNERKYNTFINQ